MKNVGDPSEPSSRFARMACGWGGAVVLAILYWVIAVASVVHQSPGGDEPPHLLGGYTYWRFADFRIQSENGNFPQRWAAIPLLFSDTKFPSIDQQAWRNEDRPAIIKSWFYEMGNDWDAMMWRGRAMIALLGAATCLIVYGWSRHLFGRVGGILSATLCAFCPTMLAHGPRITSDMAAGFFYIASLWALWTLMRRVSIVNILLAGAATAGFALSKFSVVLLGPIVALIIVLRLISGGPLLVSLGKKRLLTGRGKQLAALTLAGFMTLLIVWVLIWSAFDFRYQGLVAGMTDPTFFSAKVDKHVALAGRFAPMVRKVFDWHLLPEAYLGGFGRMMKYAGSREAFLMGQYSITGWKEFFPIAFLIKTPLFTLAILILALAGSLTRWSRPGQDGKRHFMAAMHEGLYPTVPLRMGLLVYAAAAMVSHLNIGHRHLVPIYPLLFVLAGAASYWIVAASGWRKWIVPALAAALVVESVTFFPNYIAYFNQAIGGPTQGYHYLVESSVDDGQDLPGVKTWINRHPDAASGDIYLAYFGYGEPTAYGINAHLLPSKYCLSQYLPPLDEPLKGGTYIICFTLLQQVYGYPTGHWQQRFEYHYQQLSRRIENAMAQDAKATPLSVLGVEMDAYERLRFGRLCACLRQREPDEFVGYSMGVYRLSDEQIHQALAGEPPFGH